MSYLDETVSYWSRGYDAENVDAPAFRFYGRILKPFGPREGKLLDFGCGRGAALRFFLAKGFDAYGVDISAVDLDAARQADPASADRLLEIELDPQGGRRLVRRRLRRRHVRPGAVPDGRGRHDDPAGVAARAAQARRDLLRDDDGLAVVVVRGLRAVRARYAARHAAGEPRWRLDRGAVHGLRGAARRAVLDVRAAARRVLQREVPRRRGAGLPLHLRRPAPAGPTRPMAESASGGGVLLLVHHLGPEGADAARAALAAGREVACVSADAAVVAALGRVRVLPPGALAAFEEAAQIPGVFELAEQAVEELLREQPALARALARYGEPRAIDRYLCRWCLRDASALLGLAELAASPELAGHASIEIDAGWPGASELALLARVAERREVGLAAPLASALARLRLPRPGSASAASGLRAGTALSRSSFGGSGHERPRCRVERSSCAPIRPTGPSMSAGAGSLPQRGLRRRRRDDQVRRGGDLGRGRRLRRASPARSRIAATRCSTAPRSPSERSASPLASSPGCCGPRRCSPPSSGRRRLVARARSAGWSPSRSSGPRSSRAQERRRCCSTTTSIRRAWRERSLSGAQAVVSSSTNMRARGRSTSTVGCRTSSTASSSWTRSRRGARSTPRRSGLIAD